jgi:hypothetical protein
MKKFPLTFMQIIEINPKIVMNADEFSPREIRATRATGFNCMGAAM